MILGETLNEQVLDHVNIPAVVSIQVKIPPFDITNCNPIEMAFSKLNTMIKKAVAHSCDALWKSVVRFAASLQR